MKIKMKALKWWQGLLIAIGTILLAVGGVFLYVYFTSGIGPQKVYPNDIAFEIKGENGETIEEYNEALGQFELSENFSMKIGTATEGVTQKILTLSFSSNFTETAVDGYITNGVITIPQKVEIGKEFEIKVNQEDGWNIGGIATIYAMTENKLLLPSNAKIAIDVPVKEIEAKINDTTSNREYFINESTEVFNIIKGTNVRVSANFTPSSSEYIYSDNKSDLENKRKKDFFIEVLEGKDNFVMNSDDDGIYFSAVGNLDSTAKIKIYTFKNAKDQLDFYSKFNENSTKEEIYNSAIVELSQKTEKACVVEANIKIVEATVSEFKVNRTQKMELKSNKLYTIRANSNTYSELVLGTTILDDMKESVPGMISKVALRVLKNVGEEWTETDEVKIVGAKSVTIDGKKYTYINSNVRDLNNSYWEISSEKEGEYRIEVVLIVSNDGDNIFNNQTYTFNVSFEENVEASVSWNVDDTNINMIVFTDGSSTTQYEKKLNELIDVPAQNIYQKVVYFAYFEGWGDNQNTVKEYINIDSYKEYSFSKADGSIETLKMAELSSPYLLIKKGIEGLKIRFATVKTDAYGNALIVDGKYQIVKWSSDLNVNALEKIKGLNADKMQIQATNCLLYDDGGIKYYVLPKDKEIVLKIDLDDSQKSLFVKQYNQGLIALKLRDNETNQEYSDIFESLILDSADLKFTAKLKDSVVTGDGLRKITFKIFYTPTQDISEEYEIKFKTDGADGNSCGFLTIYESKPTTIKNGLDTSYNVKATQNGEEWNIEIQGTTIEAINESIKNSQVLDRFKQDITTYYPIQLSTTNSKILMVNNIDKEISFGTGLGDKTENVSLILFSGSAESKTIQFSFTTAQVTKIEYLKDTTENQTVDNNVNDVDNKETKTTDLNSITIKKWGYSGNGITLSNLVKIYTGITASDYNAYSNLKFHLRDIAGMGDNKDYLFGSVSAMLKIEGTDANGSVDSTNDAITTETNISKITVQKDFYGDYILKLRIEGLGISVDLDLVLMNNVVANSALPTTYKKGSATVDKPADVLENNTTYIGVYADYPINLNDCFNVLKSKTNSKIDWSSIGAVSGEGVTKNGNNLTFNKVTNAKIVNFTIYENLNNPFTYNQNFKCYVYPNIELKTENSLLSYTDIANGNKKNISDYYTIKQYVYTTEPAESITELNYELDNGINSVIAIDNSQFVRKDNGILNLFNGDFGKDFEIIVKNGETQIQDYSLNSVVQEMRLELGYTMQDIVDKNNSYMKKVRYDGRDIVLLTYPNAESLTLNSVNDAYPFGITASENTGLINKQLNDNEFMINGLTQALSYGTNYYLPLSMYSEIEGIKTLVAYVRLPLLISREKSIFAYYKNYAEDNENYDLKTILTTATEVSSLPQDIYAEVDAGTTVTILHKDYPTLTLKSGETIIKNSGDTITIGETPYSYKYENGKLTLNDSIESTTIDDVTKITVSGTEYTVDYSNEGFYKEANWISTLSVIREQKFVQLTAEQLTGRKAGENITLKLKSESSEIFSNWDKITIEATEYTWSIVNGKLKLQATEEILEGEDSKIEIDSTKYEISYWTLVDVETNADNITLVSVPEETGTNINIKSLANEDRFVILQIVLKDASSTNAFSYIYRIKVKSNVTTSKEYPYGGNVEYLDVDGTLIKDLSQPENGKNRFNITPPNSYSSTNSIKSILIDDKEYTIGGQVYNLVFTEESGIKTYKAGSLVTIAFNDDNMTINMLKTTKNVKVDMVKTYNDVENGDIEYTFLINVSDKNYTINLDGETIDYKGSKEIALNPSGEQSFTVKTMTKVGSTETGVGENVKTTISVDKGYTLKSTETNTYSLKKDTTEVAKIVYDPTGISNNLKITPNGPFTSEEKFNLIFSAQEYENEEIKLNQSEIATLKVTIGRTVIIEENALEFFGGKEYDLVGGSGLIIAVKNYENNVYTNLNKYSSNEDEGTITIGETPYSYKYENGELTLNDSITSTTTDETTSIIVGGTEYIVTYTEASGENKSRIELAEYKITPTATIKGTKKDATFISFSTDKFTVAMLNEDKDVTFTITVRFGEKDYKFSVNKTFKANVKYKNGNALVDNKDDAYIYVEKETKTAGDNVGINFDNFATLTDGTGITGTDPLAIESVNGETSQSQVTINSVGKLTITPQNVAITQVCSYAIEIRYTFGTFGDYTYNFFVNVNLTVKPNTTGTAHYPAPDGEIELTYETIKAEAENVVSEKGEVDIKYVWRMNDIWNSFFDKPSDLSLLGYNRVVFSGADGAPTVAISRAEDVTYSITGNDVTLTLAKGKSAGTVVFTITKNAVKVEYEVYLIAGDVYIVNEHYTIGAIASEKIDQINRDSLSDKKIFANNRLVAMDIPTGIDTALNNKVATITYEASSGDSKTTQFKLDTNKKGLTIYVETGYIVSSIESIEIDGVDYKEEWNARLAERISVSYNTKEGPKEINKELINGTINSTSFENYDITDLSLIDTTYTATYSLKIGNASTAQITNRSYMFRQVLDIAVGMSYENSFITVSVHEVNEDKRNLVKLANIYHPSTLLPLTANDIDEETIKLEILNKSTINDFITSHSNNTIYINHQDEINASIAKMDGVRFLSYTDIKTSGGKEWNYLLYGEGAANNGSWALLKFTYTASSATKDFYIWVRIIPDYEISVDGTVITVLDGETYSVSENRNSPYERTPVDSNPAYTVNLVGGNNPLVKIIDTNTNSSDKATSWTYTMTPNADDNGILYNTDLDKIKNNNNTILSESNPDYTLEKSDNAISLTKADKNIFGTKRYKVNASNEYGYEAEIYFNFLPENREDPTVHSSTSLSTITEGDSFDIGAVYQELTLITGSPALTLQREITSNAGKITVEGTEYTVTYTQASGTTPSKIELKDKTNEENKYSSNGDEGKITIGGTTYSYTYSNEVLTLIGAQIKSTTSGSTTSIKVGETTYTVAYDGSRLTLTPSTGVPINSSDSTITISGATYRFAVSSSYEFKATETYPINENIKVVNIAGIDAWGYTDASYAGNIITEEFERINIDDKFITPEEMLLQYVTVKSIDFLYGEEKVKVGEVDLTDLTDPETIKTLATDADLTLREKSSTLDENITELKEKVLTDKYRELKTSNFTIPELKSWVYSDYANSENATDAVPITMRITLKYAKDGQTETYSLTHDITVKRKLEVDKSKQAVVRDGAEFNLDKNFQNEHYFSGKYTDTTNLTYIDDTLAITLPKSEGSQQSLKVDIEVKNTSATIVAKGSFVVSNTNTRVVTFYKSISKCLTAWDSVNNKYQNGTGYLIKADDKLNITFSNYEGNGRISAGDNTYEKFYVTYGYNDVREKVANTWYGGKTTTTTTTTCEDLTTTFKTASDIRYADGKYSTIAEDFISAGSEVTVIGNYLTGEKVSIRWTNPETSNTTEITDVPVSSLKYSSRTGDVSVTTQTQDKICIPSSDQFSETKMPEVVKSYIIKGNYSYAKSYRVEKKWIVTPYYYSANNLSYGTDMSAKIEVGYNSGNESDGYFVNFNTWASDIKYSIGSGNNNPPTKNSSNDVIGSDYLNIMIGNKETAGTASVENGNVKTRTGYPLGGNEFIQLIIKVKASGVDGSFSNIDDVNDYHLGNLRLFVKNEIVSITTEETTSITVVGTTYTFTYNDSTSALTLTPSTGVDINSENSTITIGGTTYSYTYSDGILTLEGAPIKSTNSESTTITVGGTEYTVKYTPSKIELTDKTNEENKYSSNGDEGTITIGGVAYSYTYSDETLILGDGAVSNAGKITIGGKEYTVTHTPTKIELTDATNKYSSNGFNGKITIGGVVYSYAYSEGVLTLEGAPIKSTNSRKTTSITVVGTEYTVTYNDSTLTLTPLTGEAINSENSTITIGETTYSYTYSEGVLTLKK